MSEKCPKCGSQLLRLWGHGWDWDLAVCGDKDCCYEKELDESTGLNQDGTVFVVKKEE